MARNGHKWHAAASEVSTLCGPVVYDLSARASVSADATVGLTRQVAVRRHLADLIARVSIKDAKERVVHSAIQLLEDAVHETINLARNLPCLVERRQKRKTCGGVATPAAKEVLQ